MDGNGSISARRWTLPAWWPLRPPQPDQELWRRLAVQLHYDLPRPEWPRSAMLVSVAAEEIGARASLALGAALADELGKAILLIDASPPGRALSGLLDCNGERGLSDALVDPGPAAARLALSTTHPNVAVLAAGTHGGANSHVTTDRLSALVRMFEQHYEFVLIFAGATPANPVALALAPVVGCVLLLGEENATVIEDLDAAEEALRIRRVRDLAIVVVNRVRDRS